MTGQLFDFAHFAGVDALSQPLPGGLVTLPRISQAHIGVYAKCQQFLPANITVLVSPVLGSAAGYQQEQATAVCQLSILVAGLGLLYFYCGQFPHTVLPPLGVSPFWGYEI